MDIEHNKISRKLLFPIETILEFECHSRLSLFFDEFENESLIADFHFNKLLIVGSVFIAASIIQPVSAIFLTPEFIRQLSLYRKHNSNAYKLLQNHFDFVDSEQPPLS